MGNKIKPEICTQCRFFEWKNNCHWCFYYKEYLNNLTPCNYGDIDDFEDFLNKKHD
jgi:hypothetical protein